MEHSGESAGEVFVLLLAGREKRVVGQLLLGIGTLTRGPSSEYRLQQ